jgi:hypothetical protein
MSEGECSIRQPSRSFSGEICHVLGVNQGQCAHHQRQSQDCIATRVIQGSDPRVFQKCAGAFIRLEAIGCAPRSFESMAAIYIALPGIQGKDFVRIAEKILRRRK